MRVAIFPGIKAEYVEAALPGAEIVSKYQKPDALFVRSDKLDEKSIPKSVFAVCRAGAGVDNIPLKWCNENGVVVFNAPGANANAVKELVVWAIVTAARNLANAVEFSSQRRYWTRISFEGSRQKFTGSEISGKSIFLIGAGAIGKLLIRDLSALGMRVFACDPFVPENFFGAAERVDSLEKMPPCDFISLHCALDEQTRGMVDERFLSRVKSGVKILNFARPELVDRDALKSALRDKIVDRYITDFHDTELSMLFWDRVLTLPHIGAMTEEAERRAQDAVARQFADFWTTGAIENSVNFPRCSMPKRGGDTRIVAANFNVPTMIARITEILGFDGYNISQMFNVSRGSVGYNIIDIDNPNNGLNETVVKIAELEGITRVRII